MSDFQNMLRDLRGTRRLNREQREQRYLQWFWYVMAAWVALFFLLRFAKWLIQH